jgi:hypothetical protein
MQRGEWSDDGTEIPRSHRGDEKEDMGITIVGAKEGRLIDFDEEEETDQDQGVVKMTPAEKLKLLLKQMEVEVRDSTPAPSRIQARPVEKRAEEQRGGWRDERRRGVPQRDRQAVQSRTSSPERPQLARDDQEEESPPTPPPRITNPYLYSARRTSDDREWVLSRHGLS